MNRTPTASTLKALLFDVDGTLYRQKPLRRAMLTRLAAAYLMRPIEGMQTIRVLNAYRKAQERLRTGGSVSGSIAEAQLQFACEQTGAAREVVTGCVMRWMEQEPLPLLARYVYSDLHALLQEAKARSLTLGVVSDYPAKDKLQAMGLSGFFDVIVTAQDTEVNAFKPDPRGLEVAAQRLGVEKHEVLYIGDRSEVDGEAAAAAGISAMILTNSPSSQAPTDRWSEMPDYRAIHTALFDTLK